MSGVIVERYGMRMVRRPNGSPELKFVACRVPEILLDAIDEIARNSNRTRSEVMRRLMCESLGISWDDSDTKGMDFPPIELPGVTDAS